MSNIEQQIVDFNHSRMDDLDFTLLTHSIQSSLSSEEISNRVRYDFNTSESFCELDVTDINMMLDSVEDFANLLNDFRTVEQYAAPSPSADEISELLIEPTEVYDSTESIDMVDSVQSTDEGLAIFKSNDSSLPVTDSHIEKLRTKNPSDQSILLSKSVAVTLPKPNQLQLVHPIEDTFRARYKSDYFPQNGAVRRPRYVADNAGNHFITLQMPSEFNRDLTKEYIRVALITTSINGRGHFYSPYKFQTNHDDVKVPDQNPIYIPVQTHQGNKYTMKLHLVLIKSKLDQLYDAQPLKPFSDTIGNIQNIINEDKLASKDLINTYQLDKSHIAFTLCTKSPNGLYDIHPETTIISSIITESSTKQSVASNNKPESVNSNSRKKVRCPNCKHCFDPTDVDTSKKVNKSKTKHTTSLKVLKTATNNRANKKKKST